MRRFIWLFIALIWGVSLTGQPWSGPFGLKMGLSVKQIESAGITLTLEKEDLYLASSVPSPHRDFESYMLVMSPTSGLAKIIAISKDIQTNSQGHSLRGKFEDIQTVLESKYGESETMDLLMPGSIWDDPGDFMMAIKLEERILVCSWFEDNDSMKAYNLDAIALQAKATDSNTGYLSLLYEFTNFPDYIYSVSEKDKGVF